MQDNRDHRRLQAGGTLDGQIDRTRRFRLDPIAEAAKRPVGGNCCPDTGAEGVEGGVTGGPLDDRLDVAGVKKLLLSLDYIQNELAS